MTKVLALLVSIAVSGCGIASVPELHHEIEDAAALIQKDLGARPRIGFGGWNGTVLKSVDVVFNMAERFRNLPYICTYEGEG